MHFSGIFCSDLCLVVENETNANTLDFSTNVTKRFTDNPSTKLENATLANTNGTTSEEIKQSTAMDIVSETAPEITEVLPEVVLGLTRKGPLGKF